MPKEKKAARVADMIAARMKIGAGPVVSVHSDTPCGWAANVFAGPSQLFGDQVLAAQIAAELRDK